MFGTLKRQIIFLWYSDLRDTTHQTFCLGLYDNCRGKLFTSFLSVADVVYIASVSFHLWGHVSNMGPTVPYGLYMYLVPSCYLHNTTSRSSLSVIHVYDAHVIYIGLILSMTKDMDHHMFFLSSPQYKPVRKGRYKCFHFHSLIPIQTEICLCLLP